jgi:hypothetical protein
MTAEEKINDTDEGRDLDTKLRKTGPRDLEIKPAEEDARGGL